ncbi:3-ketoacyl-CoA synthase 20-like [Salvia miltiorrhiza]|uniref:3-ketoacyl-CoA synthase 20-like n=1 Tax=Salvia miltiorrhiza TaxID=226208 RepID=UPI0025ABCC3D|nr:3-ketoacyl-CoA synthase 20-like [Salvia miltiorrhiza]
MALKNLKILIKHCYHHLISNALFLIIPALLSTAIHHLSINPHDLYNHMSFNATAATIFTLLTARAYFLRRRKVYLVDFACYKHDRAFLTNRDAIRETMSGLLSPESLAFSSKVIERSGVGRDAFVYGHNDFPPKSSFACAREEAEIVVCGAVDELMAKTGVDASEIGVVVVNISTFNPVPSLSAMIVNRYKLREDVLSYNLGGMGCSAGLIAVDLAKNLLQVGRNTYALIMSLESPTSSYYLGNDRSKLLSNCLFRMGGAAVLLSNRPSDRHISKYELNHTHRTHRGADDRAYRCVLQEPDKEGILGMSISKDLMVVAGEALKANITTLGSLVLPISEQLLFLATLIARKYLHIKGLTPYVPDFKLAFEHFCIHAGGKAVLDEVEKSLKLTTWDMEPSRMTLYRYSNTSSSSLWYQLAYAEAKGRVQRGDRVWQIGFGSGFKCASGVWRALRTISPHQLDNPWVEVIDQFPVFLPN